MTSPIVPNGERIDLTGTRWEVQPGDDAFGIEVQHTTDGGVSGAGSAATSAFVTIIELPAGRTVFGNFQPLTTQRHYYRIRHVREGFIDGPFSTAVCALPTPFGGQDEPEFPRLVEGTRRLETLYDSDATLKSGTLIVETDPRTIVRHPEGSVIAGGTTDGEITVEFPAPYESAPDIMLVPHQVISWNEGLSTASDHYLRLQNLNVSSSGFVLRAQNVITGALTARADNYPVANSLSTEGANTQESLTNAPSNDDVYNNHYSVVLTAENDLGTPSTQVTSITVKIRTASQTSSGASFLERVVKTYSCQQVGVGTNTCTWSSEETSPAVTALDSSGAFRLDIKQRTDSVGGGGGEVTATIHGFSSSGGDPDDGINYNTASDTVESAIPSTGDGVRYFAFEIA